VRGRYRFSSARAAVSRLPRGVRYWARSPSAAEAADSLRVDCERGAGSEPAPPSGRLRARRRSCGSLTGRAGLNRQQAVGDLPIFSVGVCWNAPEPASTKGACSCICGRAAVLVPLARRWLLLLNTGSEEPVAGFVREQHLRRRCRRRDDGRFGRIGATRLLESPWRRVRAASAVSAPACSTAGPSSTISRAMRLSVGRGQRP
jgi:hypothetical protein